MLHHATAEYVDLPGWQEDLTGCRSEADLPQAARDYLQFIADHTGVPIAQISIGPARDQVIWTEVGNQTVAGRTPSVV
nr:adenylosuccinate synthetase [Conexibacter sp. W3-3-2]